MANERCLVDVLRPEGFIPRMEVAGCYCECQDKLLILKRHFKKSHGNTWGVPAGKLEVGEDALSAVVREINEEIGMVLAKGELRELGRLYVQDLDIQFIYHMFYKKFNELPEIQLNLDEHAEFKWVAIEEALRMNLMPGEWETLQFYLKFKAQ